MKAGDDVVFECVDGRFVGRVVEVLATGLLTVAANGSTYSTYEENVRRVFSDEDKRRIRSAFETIHRSAENEDSQPKEFAEAMATLLGFVRDEVPRLFFSSAAWNELPYLLSSEAAFREVLEAGSQLLQLKRLFDERSGVRGSPGVAHVRGGTVTVGEGGVVEIQPPALVTIRPGEAVELLPEPGTPKTPCQECGRLVSSEFAVCLSCYEKRQQRKPMKAVEDGWVGSRRA